MYHCDRAKASFCRNVSWSCDVCVSSAVRQGPALRSLWEQCCCDCATVRSACCDAVVLMVGEGHADLPFILNNVLNLLPSARYPRYTSNGSPPHV